jgi:hypothetical protein
MAGSSFPPGGGIDGADETLRKGIYKDVMRLKAILKSPYRSSSSSGRWVAAAIDSSRSYCLIWFMSRATSGGARAGDSTRARSGLLKMKSDEMRFEEIIE